jgi:choline-sulfatase
MRAANTLVIMSDEHQARAMGCAGHAFVQTPNLDRLAARGLRFTNAVTPSPICVPARAAFATGQYVHRCGYWDNSMGYDGRVRGWGHALQEAGVPVESIGKLHYQKEGLSTGFDAQHIPMHLYKGIGMAWASIRDPLPKEKPTDKRMLGDYIGPGESDYTRYDRSVTDRAVDWIKSRDASSDRPWCLFVGLVAPHFPLVAPPEYYAMYPPGDLPEPKLQPRNGYRLHPWLQEHEDFWSQDATLRDEAERRTAMAAYYGLVSWLDANVGAMLAALEEAGLTGSTRVVYASDHGDNLGARGLWGKSNLYRESVDVPIIAAGPEVPTGVCATPVSLLDVSAGILDSLGLDSRKALPACNGRSLFAIATEPADAERILFSEYHAVGSNTAAFMLRKGRWKYHHYVRHAPELFDIEADPQELNDLAGRPEFVAKLAELDADLRAICDPDEADRAAKRDQAALIERLGGIGAVFNLGKAVAGGTPPPKT